MAKKNAKASGKSKPAVKSFRAPAERSYEDPHQRFLTLPLPLSYFSQFLDPRHIYIISLDREDRSVKLQAFLASFCLNLAIVGFAIYRVYTGFFTYPALVSALWSEKSPARNMPVDAGTLKGISMVVVRSSGLMVDYLLVNFLLPLPVQFFLEGPLAWRRAIGLQRTEVVIRKDRGWARKLDDQNWFRQLRNPTIDDIIIPSTAAEQLGKTGYLLMDKHWALDFEAMIQAHKVISEHKAQFEDFRTACLFRPYAPLIDDDEHAKDLRRNDMAHELSEEVKSRGAESSNSKGNDKSSSNSSTSSSSASSFHDTSGWLMWRIDPFDEQEEENESTQRNKMEQIRQRLVDLDKEDVFYRWIEILQYEMSAPAESDKERHKKCDEQTRELFTSNGLDFDQFYEEVDGMKGVIA